MGKKKSSLFAGAGPHDRDRIMTGFETPKKGKPGPTEPPKAKIVGVNRKTGSTPYLGLQVNIKGQARVEFILTY